MEGKGKGTRIQGVLLKSPPSLNIQYKIPLSPLALREKLGQFTWYVVSFLTGAPLNSVSTKYLHFLRHLDEFQISCTLRI